MKKNDITNEIKNYIIELYNSGKSGSQISKIVGCSSTMVYNILKKNNIPTRINNNKYTFNKNFFDSIDTEEKAYILGFFYADGYNDQKTGLIKIELHNKDIDIIEKIILSMESNNEIKTEKSIYKKLCISSRYLSNKLAELGAPQNKSNKITFPDFINKNLMRHFIRGYFDGDGCVCLTVHGKASAKFECNDIFGKQLMNYLIKNNIISKYGISKRRENCISSSYYIQGGHDAIIYFLDYIYKDSNIYSNRKYKRYLDYSNI